MAPERESVTAVGAKQQPVAPSSSAASVAYIDIARAERPALSSNSTSDGEPAILCTDIQKDPGIFRTRNSTTGPATRLFQQRSGPQRNVFVEDPERPSSFSSRFFFREFRHPETPPVSPSPPLTGEGRRCSSCSTEDADIYLANDPTSVPAGSPHHLQPPPRWNYGAFSGCVAAPRESHLSIGCILSGYAVLCILFAMGIGVLCQAFRPWFLSRVASKEPATAAPTGVIRAWRGGGDSGVTDGGGFAVFQLVSDSVYLLLVLASLVRWVLFPYRHQLVVLLRFSWCLLVGAVLKLIISFAFALQFEYARGQGAEFTETAGARLVLLLRVALGMTLSEAVDPLPGYSRLVVVLLCLFWCMYTWKYPVVLGVPAICTTAICLLGLLKDARTLLDLVLATSIASVVVLLHHILLDKAAREVYRRLRRQRRPHLEEGSAGRSRSLEGGTADSQTRGNKGKPWEGGFFACGLWGFVVAWVGHLELLEERVMIAVREEEALQAQQHPERNIYSLQEGFKLNPVVGDGAMAGGASLTDERLWSIICDTYCPNPGVLTAETLRDWASQCCKCLRKTSPDRRVLSGVLPPEP